MNFTLYLHMPILPLSECHGPIDNPINCSAKEIWLGKRQLTYQSAPPPEFCMWQMTKLQATNL